MARRVARTRVPARKRVPSIDMSQPIKLVEREGVPERFHQFDEREVLAIRSALGACRPLLVRGEPGVGKTQLAEAAAVALKRPLRKLVVNSRTEARDLLWDFDAVERLAEAQIAAAYPVGLQHASDPDGSKDDDSGSSSREQDLDAIRDRLAVKRFVRPGPLWWAFNWKSAEDQANRSRTPIVKEPAGIDPSNGVVVLIDEIDKAESDVPNGLLEALGAREFTPKGHHEPIRVSGGIPLVVITTNEERVLPDAFLRRCLVLHLDIPEKRDELIEFLVGRAEVHFEAYAEEALTFFRLAAASLVEERQAAIRAGTTPLPGQAEYLDLVRAVLSLEETPDGWESVLESVAQYALKKTQGPTR